MSTTFREREIDKESETEGIIKASSMNQFTKNNVTEIFSSGDS